ncbi:MAG: 50S ribosome-binding GTPase, partial [Nitrospirae bacterium]|nr:50S ribosome-binding GTPase [Nitrospirota bacterium]
YREGLYTAIVGKPNVGKSSLLNARLKKDRAIVTPDPGTTRDTIEEAININGLPVRLVDTAGIRQGCGLAEAQGINRCLAAIEAAAIVVVVFDGSAELTAEDDEILRTTHGKAKVIALNKADKERAYSNDFLIDKYRLANDGSTVVQVISISALSGFGLDTLKEALYRHAVGGGNCPESHDGVIITNLRHKCALEEAAQALNNAHNSLSADAPYEITAIELRNSLGALGQITGAVTTADILDKIFSDFCIGK